ncbi:hypothetical protein HN011_010968 [Eciton burchellii]|nr:hypothetical protein HN011_010968 [Eciton burchellii]
MNARLCRPAAGGEGGDGGETEGKEEGIIMEDGRQRPGRCSDRRGDNWIGNTQSVYALFDERHVTTQSEMDFMSRELSNLPPRDATTVPSNVLGILPSNIAAPFSNVAPHMSDITGSRTRGIEISIPRSAIRSASGGGYNAAPACNIAPVLCNDGPTSCNIASTPCNIAPASANCYDAQARLPRNSLVPQLETCAANTTTSRNCQLGAVDVEDLAMYFDLSTDNSKSLTSSRMIHAIHTRRSKQAARMDQSRQERRERFDGGSNYDRGSYSLLYPCLEPSDPRPCDVRSEDPRFSDLAAGHPRAYPQNPLSEGLLEYSGATSNLPRDLEFSNDPPFGDPRFCHSGFSDLQRPRDLAGPSDSAQSCDSLPGSWFCNSCPEFFNFCSEDRWLQCPASDRCPLYDTSHPYDALVLPPCMYENLQASGKDHGYMEDEQLLEDYL